MIFTIWSLIACACAATSVLAAPAPLVPIHRVSKRAPNGGYIVKFKDGAVPPANRRKWIDNQLNKASLAPLTDDQVGALRTGWRSDVFDGFCGQLSEEAVKAFVATGDVDFIAEDGEATITGIATQSDATWGLQRLSQKDPLKTQKDKDQDFSYTYDDSAGGGVDIYIIDTGVQANHPEFEGRATFAQSFGNGVPGQDVHGHGTHVAGIAASKSFGVSKKSNIIGVKVMADDGRGDTSNIIDGINFAVQQAFKTDTKKSSIINISIISDGTPALDAAVANAVNLGIHVVVGAGNDNKDAKDSSPARAPSVITVGATNIKDDRTNFSNFGKVDVFAPGENILSTLPGSKTGFLSGTSMAAPFVSGLVAYLIGLDGDMRPADMKARIQSLSSKSIINSVPTGTLNEFAFNGAPPQGPTSSSGLSDSQKQQVISAAKGLISMFDALSKAAATAQV